MTTWPCGKRFSGILDCTNADEDAASLPWQQATDMVVNGEAAFNIMGGWAAGYMSTTLGLTPGEGFGWAPAPAPRACSTCWPTRLACRSARRTATT